MLTADVPTALASGVFTENEMYISSISPLYGNADLVTLTWANQMMTFLIAGHETTASSFVWAISMLCKYSHIQVRLRDEVQAKLPDPR